MGAIVPRHKMLAFYGVTATTTDSTTTPPTVTLADEAGEDAPTVLTDIVGITDGELCGADAVREIITVDTETGDAFKRSYTVSPGSEGDDAQIYKYSGSFKANGEQIKGTAASSDEWMTVTFTESGS